MPPSYRDSVRFVEQDANLDRADAGEDVTNSDDAGDNVTNSDDGGKDDTNLGSVLTPDSTPEIKIEKGARVELTSTPASARRKLDLDMLAARRAMKKLLTLFQQINTHGDITLSDLREYVEQKKLSLEKVEPVFNAIRPRHDDAISSDPKDMCLRRGQQKLSRQISDSFFQSFSSRKLNQRDGMLSYAGSPTTDERHRMKTSSINLDVGTFSLVDIDTMYEWHCLKKKNRPHAS
ncbi:hypothetical protein GQ600_19991 [Phytophthora cactorum]|nr:hypothetical protein GQ600_19991 [Phytophthora cactorum]